jgi:hypothetical protein
MKCPNCGFDQADDSIDCPACGLIFAKWRERHQQTSPAFSTPETVSTPEPASAPETESKKSFQLPASAWMLIAMAVIVVGSLFLFLGKEKEKPVSAVSPTAAAPVSAVTVAQNEPTPTEAVVQAPTPTPFTGNPWKFQGKVIDMLHLNPIAGATVAFECLNVSVSTTTDAEGKYQIDLPPQPAGRGYIAQLSHPDFGGMYWEGDWSKYTRRQRISVRDQISAHAYDRIGKPGEVVICDFSMYPAKLTEEEAREWQNTIAPPARD